MHANERTSKQGNVCYVRNKKKARMQQARQDKGNSDDDNDDEDANNECNELNNEIEGLG